MRVASSSGGNRDREPFDFSTATLALGRRSPDRRVDRRSRRERALGSVARSRSRRKRALLTGRGNSDLDRPDARRRLVASAVLPRILRAFCEFELGFGSAFVITLGRSLAVFAVGAVLSTFVLARGAAVPSSAALFVVAEIVSLAVGY
jgi:transposase InsO family protein